MDANHVYLSLWFFWCAGHDAFWAWLCLDCKSSPWVAAIVLPADDTNRIYHWFECQLLGGEYADQRNLTCYLSVNLSNLSHWPTGHGLWAHRVIMLFIRSGWLLFYKITGSSRSDGTYQLHLPYHHLQHLFPGLRLFRYATRYELYYLVFGIWIFQLIVSPIWL